MPVCAAKKVFPTIWLFCLVLRRTWRLLTQNSNFKCAVCKIQTLYLFFEEIFLTRFSVGEVFFRSQWPFLHKFRGKESLFVSSGILNLKLFSPASRLETLSSLHRLSSHQLLKSCFLQTVLPVCARGRLPLCVCPHSDGFSFALRHRRK